MLKMEDIREKLGEMIIDRIDELLIEALVRIERKKRKEKEEALSKSLKGFVPRRRGRPPKYPHL